MKDIYLSNSERFSFYYCCYKNGKEADLNLKYKLFNAYNQN